MGTLRLRLPFRRYPPPLLLAALDLQPPLFSRAHSISGRPFCEMGGGPLPALTNATEGSPHQVFLLDLTRSSPSRPSLAPPLVATSILATPVPATPLPGAAPRGHARPGHARRPSRSRSFLAPPVQAAPVQATPAARPGHACPGHN
jgi:hypothetical protein